METNRAWVDFNLVKASVTMEMLIVQYGITGLSRNGDELRGICPVHRGRSKREFSVNLTKNTFRCFAPNCKARGNVLDFVARMESCTVRDAALKIDEWFGVTKQGRGESEASGAGNPLPHSAEAAASLLAEIKAHVSLALRHGTCAEAKIADLKQLLDAR